MQKKASYRLEGLHCASCAMRSEKILKKTEGVEDAVCNFATSEAQITFNPDKVTPQQLSHIVEQAGYRLIVTPESEDALTEQQRTQYHSALLNMSIALILWVCVLLLHHLLGRTALWSELLQTLFATIVVAYAGREFFINAYKQARMRTANMDTLVATSTAAAYIFSIVNLLYPHWNGGDTRLYFDSACGIVSFILIGRMLESKAKADTATSLKKLMQLRPTTATLIESDAQGQKKYIEVDIKSLHVGDHLLVHPGEKLPLDGHVISGSSYVDESMLSGEPTPVKKQDGAEVFEGTLNGKGALEIAVSKTAADTVLAHIINTVHEAQNSKAPVQHTVDKVAAIFVPTVFGIALLAALSWYFLSSLPAHQALTQAIMSAVTVLVVACPCALGLATPTALMVGIGRAAQKGILIKDAISLETARKVDVVVFDKTGTITLGRPEVITPLHFAQHLNAQQQEHIKQVVAAIEQQSEHPLAEAVVRAFYTDTTLPITAFESLTGQGVKAEVDGETWWVGNERLLLQHHITPLTADDMPSTATPIYVAIDNRCVLLMAVADSIKPTSQEAIDALRQLHLQTHLLTGDTQRAATATAERMHITHAKGGVLPIDKSQYVKDLQAQGHCVAMVGDGINDSAALATADLSIAMGQGADVAMSIAQTTIIRSDLRCVAETIRLSRRTQRIIYENLFWAFVYNLLLIPIAAGILIPINGFTLPPIFAAAAMALSSVTVVTNSLRLKRA